MRRFASCIAELRSGMCLGPEFACERKLPKRDAVDLRSGEGDKRPGYRMGLCFAHCFVWGGVVTDVVRKAELGSRMLSCCVIDVPALAFRPRALPPIPTAMRMIGSFLPGHKRTRVPPKP